MLLELAYLLACTIFTYLLVLKPKSPIFLAALAIFCFVLFGLFGLVGFSLGVGAKMLL